MEDRNNGEKSDFIEVGGLWKGKKPGHLSGGFGMLVMHVTKNYRKEEGSNQPDFEWSLAARLKPDDAGNMSDEDLVFLKCGGLWKGKKPGSLSGSFGKNAMIRIFANRFKDEGSNQPDFRWAVTPRERKPDDTQGGNQGGGYSGGGSSGPSW